MDTLKYITKADKKLHLYSVLVHLHESLIFFKNSAAEVLIARIRNEDL